MGFGGLGFGVWGLGFGVDYSWALSERGKKGLEQGLGFRAWGGGAERGGVFREAWGGEEIGGGVQDRRGFRGLGVWGGRGFLPRRRSSARSSKNWKSKGRSEPEIAGGWFRV